MTHGPLAVFANKADAEKLNTTMTEEPGYQQLWCLPCLEFSITPPPLKIEHLKHASFSIFHTLEILLPCMKHASTMHGYEHYHRHACM